MAFKVKISSFSCALDVLPGFNILFDGQCFYSLQYMQSILLLTVVTNAMARTQGIVTFLCVLKIKKTKIVQFIFSFPFSLNPDLTQI